MLLLKLENLMNSFSEILGKVSAVLFILLLFNVFFDVIMRYLFNDVSIGMQEMEWHLYASLFMLAIPYTLRHDGHVRVDLIYERLSVKKKAWVDLLGALFLLTPITLIIIWYGIDFAFNSFELGEISGDPGGLPYRWIIKAVIPFTFLAIFISGLGMIFKSINTIRGLHNDDDYSESNKTELA